MTLTAMKRKTIMNKISKKKFVELVSISGLPLENPEILENNDIEMIDYGEILTTFLMI